MFDLAGVGLRGRLVDTEDFTEERPEDLPFRGDPSDEVLAEGGQMNSMIFGDLDKTMLLERSELERHGGP